MVRSSIPPKPRCRPTCWGWCSRPGRSRWPTWPWPSPSSSRPARPRAATSGGRKKLAATLRRLNRELEEKIEDGPAFTRLARRFHDAVVYGCGNATMALVVGSLETLWSNHESNWAEATNAHGDYPKAPARDAVLRTHERITEAIGEADADRARHLASQHLHESQRYVLSQGKKQSITVEGLSRGTW